MVRANAEGARLQDILSAKPFSRVESGQVFQQGRLVEQRIPRSTVELCNAIGKHVEDRRKPPEVILSFFDKEEIRYATGE